MKSPTVSACLRCLVETPAIVPASVYQIQFYIRDSASLGAALARIRGIGGVEAVGERSVAIGAWGLLSVTYRGSMSALRDQLVARGWSVEYVGPTLRITGSIAPPPAPPPVPAQ